MCRLWFKKRTKKKRVYFLQLMLLCVYSNRFLRNHTGKVVPRVFRSCWKLLAFDQIQLDAYCAVVWRRFETTFNLRPVVPISERNEMSECPWKPRQSTSQGSHVISNPFPRSQHAVSPSGFFSARVLPLGFLPWEQSILCGGHSSLNRTMLQFPAAFLFE